MGNGMNANEHLQKQLELKSLEHQLAEAEKSRDALKAGLIKMAETCEEYKKAAHYYAHHQSQAQSMLLEYTNLTFFQRIWWALTRRLP